MAIQSEQRSEFWTMAVLCAVAYPIIVLTVIGHEGQDATFALPGVITAAWAAVAASLALSTRWRAGGLGMLLGLLLGLVICVVLVIVFLSLLIHDMGD